jgi:hypothetical protein
MSNQIETPIADGFNFSKEDVIPSISGKVTKLYDAQEKEGQHGPYMLQNGVLETEHGEVKFVSFGNPMDKTARGRNVTIKCGKDKKNKLGGVVYELNSYFSKKENREITEEVIKISGLAVISFEGGQSASSSESSSVVSSKAKPVVEKVAQSSVKSEDALDQLEGVFKVHALIDQDYRARFKDYDEETLRCYVNSAFIQLDKMGLVRAAACQLMPRVEVSNSPAAPSESVNVNIDPSDWKNFVVTSGVHAGKNLSEVPKSELMKFYDHVVAKKSSSLFAQCVVQAAIELEFADEIPF